MLKYIVFWNEIEIARIYQKSDIEEQYIYYPNCNVISETSAPMTIFGTPQLVWGDMPAFFEDRISKDPDLKYNCRCATDKLTIKKAT